MIDANLTKDDCANLIISKGLALPRVYAEGYPNANCIGCVKAASPTYWNLVRRTRPEVFKQRAELSRELGVRLALVKGNRVFLDELSPDAVGRPLKTMNIECGVFCEEGGLKEKPKRSLARPSQEREPMNNIGVQFAGGGDQAKRSTNDFYATPPEPTQALINHYRDIIPGTVAELACGKGHMARVFAANGYTVLASDLFHKGYGFGAIDVLTLPKIPAWRKMAFITNPPFIVADEFIERAHELGFPFIALYLKQTFWNAVKRRKLWEKYPPKACHPLTWRVDFSGQGAPTMDCMWTVWGQHVPFSNEPFRRP